MTVSAASAGRTIHITSSAIAHLRKRCQEELLGEELNYLRSLTEPPSDVYVGHPGFGTLGDVLIGDTYAGMCRRANELLGEAEKAVEGWIAALTLAERNWRAAEDASIVRYEG